MSRATERRTTQEWIEVTLTYEFKLDPNLALAWVTELVARPLVEVTPAEYVALLSCYLDSSSAGLSFRENACPRSCLLVAAR